MQPDNQPYPPRGPEQLQPQPESPYLPPEPPAGGFSKKRILLVVFILLAVAALGFGLALFQESRNSQAPLTDQPTDPALTQQQTPAINDIQTVSATKTFKSDFPRVEFTYPENWRVVHDKEQEGIRIESPEFSYTSINGGSIKGNFRIYIRQGARQQDSKYIGRGIAAQPSEKLAYSAPAPNQRPETNLSFFGIDSSDNFAFFMIAGNFALEKDETLGPEYGTEPETYIISGGYSSNEMTDDMATNPVPLEFFAQTNAYKQAITIIKSLKLL